MSGTPQSAGVVPPERTRAILLDIEGTTTPVAFVYETLFPYARDRVQRFLETRGATPEVGADVALLKREHARDVARGHELTPWSGEPAAVAAYARWLMDQDRKSTGLKSLQGRIWEEGYRTGDLRGEVYDDVPPALRRWREEGRRIAIYSSGSVLAQELLFSNTAFGDLTPFIEAHFDTTTGPKRAASSYTAIVAALDVAPASVLFVSDVAAELDAAREAGLETRLAVRTGEALAHDHPVISSFNEIRFF